MRACHLTTYLQVLILTTQYSTIIIFWSFENMLYSVGHVAYTITFSFGHWLPQRSLTPQRIMRPTRIFPVVSVYLRVDRLPNGGVRTQLRNIL